MKDKVALVTGASSGIGRATALAFARGGATVVAVGRNEVELTALRDEANEFDGAVKIHLADMIELTQVERLVLEVGETYGRLDALVNAAGIIKNGTITTTTLDDWDRMLNINLRSVFNIIQKCVPLLGVSKGNIVNVSSVTGTRAFPGVLAYCVSKAGIDQMTRCVALELAEQGIRVNAVNPGVVETNLHKRGGMEAEAYQAFLDHAKATHPLGRAGQPHEIADLIYFLASDKASWITGETIAIDGGRAQTCLR